MLRLYLTLAIYGQMALAVLCPATALADLCGPSGPLTNERSGKHAEVSPSLSPGRFILQGLFLIYQKGFGPTKGTRCPMYPSCSEFSRLAIARRGLLWGVIATADRLHRCGHDLNFYDVRWTRKGRFYEDDPH